MESVHDWHPTPPQQWFLAVLFGFVLLNLPWRYVELPPEVSGYTDEIGPMIAGYGLADGAQVLAGWPLRFLTVETCVGDTDPDADQDADNNGLLTNDELLNNVPAVHSKNATVSRRWSTAALTINVAFALVVAAIMGGACRLGRRLPQAILIVGGIIFVSLTAYNWRQDRLLAERLAGQAVVYRSAVVPNRLKRIVPTVLLQGFSRIRGAHFWQPSDALVGELSTVPTLVALGFRRHFPPSETLAPLVSQPRLTRLAVWNCSLDAAAWRFVSAQKRLRRLELVSCQGLDQGVTAIERLSELESINLTHSDVSLAALTSVLCGKPLRDIRLSGPRSGSDRIEFHDCDRLEYLSIAQNHGITNPDVLSISLESLPKLRTFNLVSTQKLDLRLVDLPSLKELRVDETDDHLTMLNPTRHVSHIWVDRLRVFDVPSLWRLACFGLELRDIEIEATPSLTELVVDSSGHSATTIRAADRRTNLSQLIRRLGESHGPPRIKLSNLPLDGVDLTPLLGNSGIRELALANTGVDCEQLKALARLPNLRSLDARACPVDDQQAADILAAVPRLEQLIIDGESFRRYQVLNRESLVDFVATPMPGVSIVRVAGSPNLADELIFGNRIEELVIRDGYSLRGLSVNGPVPPGGSLSGFRNLRFCALGGERVDDDLCRDIWHCLRLEHLTLAHANVSRQALHRIGRLEKLTALLLPGCDVDDSLTKTWFDLNHLSEIDLSHTAISSGSLPLLRSRNNLQRLALNHVDIDARDLRWLVEVPQLIELEVAGVGLETETLVGISARGMLDRLDLSDCRLTPPMRRFLASGVGHSLSYLGLRNCGLKDPDIRAIVDARPRVAIDVVGNPLSDELLAELQAAGKLLSVSDRQGFLRRLSRGDPSAAAPHDTIRGRIDVRQFRPTADGNPF